MRQIVQKLLYVQVIYSYVYDVWIEVINVYLIMYIWNNNKIKMSDTETEKHSTYEEKSLKVSTKVLKPRCPSKQTK